MSTQKTTDHRFIKTWTESRNGIPARFIHAERQHPATILRILFPNQGESDSTLLETLSWHEFFDVFDDARLAFLYENDLHSTFHEFVHRN